MPIELKNISYTYSKGTPFSKRGLGDFNFRVDDGEWIAVMGPTGSGKSTLLQHLNGLLKPDRGEVLLNGVNIHSSASALREARRKVGFVFQYPEHQLFGGTVFEEVAYGPENFGYAASDVEETVKTAMEAAGLDFITYKDRSPHELSGGEKRRVALAGVLAVNPQVIALDEPTAGLDPAGQKMLLQTINELNKAHGITVIWVTHEISEIAALADRLLVLNQGRTVLEGSVREMLEHPLLNELGLDVPVAVTVARGLRKNGRLVDGRPVTVEEIKREILRLVR
ncbi:MAG: energy-coupling factor transporter ATPase [Eubacteriales bacterium]